MIKKAPTATSAVSWGHQRFVCILNISTFLKGDHRRGSMAKAVGFAYPDGNCILDNRPHNPDELCKADHRDAQPSLLFSFFPLWLEVGKSQPSP